jgi:hypothetical protein
MVMMCVIHYLNNRRLKTWGRKYRLFTFSVFVKWKCLDIKHYHVIFSLKHFSSCTHCVCSTKTLLLFIALSLLLTPGLTIPVEWQLVAMSPLHMDK